MPPPSFFLGSSRSLDGSRDTGRQLLPAHHLVTHAVVVGMTGSGKTGLVTVMVEEALRSGVPTLVVDVKGDLTNLLLAFPSFAPGHFAPWTADGGGPGDERTPGQLAAALADERRRGLTACGLGESELAAFAASTAVRVITPGSTGGESLHVLSSLERRSPRWDTDPEAARASLSAALSLVLRLVGRDSDPARSRDHVLLSVLAERRLRAGQTADLAALLADLAAPPIEQVGALPLDRFLPKTERRSLAAALNNLLASPTFASWRQGCTLDVGDWLTPRDGQTPAVVVSVAHLDDEERALVLGVLLEEVLSWVRSLPGSQRLRALVVFDEVYGFLPPHPHNPPTKRPLVALMKQARAFGVGLVVATQNPMDLDYRALSNAGLWCIGRLQTDADRERVVDGLAGASGADHREATHELATTIQRLAPRWFVVRDAHGDGGPRLLHPRWALSWLRGPLTRCELQRARGAAPGAVARVVAAREPGYGELNLHRDRVRHGHVVLSPVMSTEPAGASADGATHDRAAGIDALCRQLGVDFEALTDPELLAEVLRDDFHLGDFGPFRERLGDRLTQPTPLRPLLDEIRRGLIDRHPAVCAFASEVIRRGQVPALDAPLARRIQRAIHHTLLLEELTRAMSTSVTFLQQLDAHYEIRLRAIGVRSNRVLGALDVYRITGMLFTPAKLASVNFALRYSLAASADGAISADELRVGRATLVTNILEAVVQDRVVGYRDNSIAGLLLAVNPHRAQRVRASDRFVEYELTQSWVSLYITWNMAFVLGNIRNVYVMLPKLLIPQVLCAPPAEFLTGRANSLYTTIRLGLFARKRDPTGRAIAGHQALARQWGEINLRHAQPLARERYGRDLTRTRDVLRTALGGGRQG